MTFPASIDELPDDWRAALTNRRLLWEGGYDPALVAVRERDHAKIAIDAWYMAFMWLFYSRNPQEWSESHDAFVMQAEWRQIAIEPAPPGCLPSLRAALAWRFADYYGVRFDDPVVIASVEYAFSQDNQAGPIGYLAATANRLWLAASRWRRYQRQAEQFPYLRFRCDAPNELRHPLSSLHGIILPLDSEFWQSAMQPNDVGHVGLPEQVSLRMLAKKGWKVADELPTDWRSHFPLGFDRNFAAQWPDVFDPGMVQMSKPI